MATTQEKWQEIANRGLQDKFDPSTRAKFDEAVKRGLITVNEPDFLGASVIEPLKTIGTGLAAQVGGGLAGIGAALNPMAEEGAGSRVVESFNRQVSQPQTAAGKEGMQTLGDLVQQGIDIVNFPLSGLAGLAELVGGQGFEQAAKTTTGIQEQGLSNTLGDRTLELTDSPLAATIAKTAPTAAMALLGAPGVASKAIQAVKPAVKATSQALKPIAKEISTLSKGVMDFQTSGNRAIAEIIKRGDIDPITAKFELKNPKSVRMTDRGKIARALDIGGPRIKKTPQAAEAVKQGFDEGIINIIKRSNPTDKKTALEMTRMMSRGLKDPEFQQLNRVWNAPGKALADRFKAVDRIGKNANMKLKRVAEGLKDKPINIDAPISTFIDDLAEIGVTIGDDLKPNFKLSDVEFSPPARRAISNVIKRAGEVENPSAFTAHRFKKTIDDMVTFGKSKAGLSGKGEAIIKKLRAGINDTLRDKFPDYGSANAIIKETIDAKDALQSIAGKYDLLSPGAASKLGSDMRGLLSSNKSRQSLYDAIDKIDTVAKKYSGSGKEMAPFGAKFSAPASFKDNMLFLTLYADELERMFGTAAKTGFQGQVKQAVDQGKNINLSGGGAANLALDVAGKVAEKAQNINTPAAFKAINELLKR